MLFHFAVYYTTGGSNGFADMPVRLHHEPQDAATLDKVRDALKAGVAAKIGVPVTGVTILSWQRFRPIVKMEIKTPGARDFRRARRN